MHFSFQNVNDAFYLLVHRIHQGIVRTEVSPSRVGEVLTIEEPVILTYNRPTERVLFCPKRDANPFFHLYEALWMLAGRNDVAPLAYYNSQITGIASDDGKTFNGAYGYRWRTGKAGYTWESVEHGDGYSGSSTQRFDRYVDQLKILIDHLRLNPHTRRAVLQMWNVEDDLLKIDVTKDVCCNLSVCFMVEDSTYLNMTVFNRSNDLVWGCLGANYVHFSILQEYVAACAGYQVGTYHQVSNNLHVYTERFKPEDWVLSHPAPEWYLEYPKTIPLVADPEVFDLELPRFVERHSKYAMATAYQEPFLATVAQPACVAYHHYRRGELQEALTVADSILAADWRLACKAWIARRIQSRKEKEHA